MTNVNSFYKIKFKLMAILMVIVIVFEIEDYLLLIFKRFLGCLFSKDDS
jgi:hypothetical protein